MGYQNLVTTELAERYPESLGGVKPVMCHGLLSGLLDGELSGGASLFLAEPIVREREGRIEWVTPLEGDPMDIRALAGAERDAAVRALSLRAGELEALGARLAGEDSGDRRLAGRLISHLAGEAADFAAGGQGGVRVFVAGGVPVMACWGLSKAPISQADGARGHELTESESDAAGSAPPDEIPPAPETGPEPPVFAPMPVPEPIPAPDPIPASGPTSVPEPLPGYPVGPMAVESGRRTHPLFWILGSLLLLLLLLALVSYLAGDRDAFNRYPLAAEGDELVIPENAEEGFGFLEGCWQSGGGIVNTRTELPVIYVHCFAADGTATVTIDEKTADGAHLDTCVSSASASIEGGTLYIRSSPEGLRCRAVPEAVYAATTVVCTGARGGNASCVIEGSTQRPIDTPFTRLSRDYRPGGSVMGEGD
ncbi:MAG: hypothetical protein LBR80_01650 [Deltaproteobacteria bacterium]|nr:hypothetical protein [Deltaproteobacteria bacterium]